MMKTMKMFSKKKLSVMLAAAFSFGAAFSLTPSDAAAAKVEITQSGRDYVFTVDGGAPKTVSAKDFAAEFSKVAAEKDNEITVTGGARSAIQGIEGGVKLAPGTILNVNKPGDANHVVLKNGTSESTLQVTGSGVTGTNVNLESIVVEAKGKTADLNLSGRVGDLSLKGDNNVNLQTAGATLDVSRLSVDGTGLLGKGATINAATADLRGAEISGTTVTAGTVTVDDKTKLEAGTVKADTVKVNDASADAVKKLIKEGKITSKADGAKLNVNTSEVTNPELKKAFKDLPGVQSTDVKRSYEPGDFVGGKLNLDGQEYSGNTLAAGIAEAYKKGAESVTLDKETAKAIKGQNLTVPATKTLTVQDGSDMVTTTAAQDSVIRVENGTKVTAESGALSSVVVNAPSNTVTADLSKLSNVGDVHVKAGVVKAGDAVTAKTVKIDAGATIETKILQAEKVMTDDPETALKNIDKLQAANGTSVEMVKSDGTPLAEADLKKIENKIPKNQQVVSGPTTIPGKGEEAAAPFDPKNPMPSYMRLAPDYAGETNKAYREKVGNNVDALNMTAVAATFGADTYNPFASDVAIGNKVQMENIRKTAGYTTANLTAFKNRVDALQKAHGAKPDPYLKGLQKVLDAAVAAATADDAASTPATKKTRTDAIAALNTYQAKAFEQMAVEKGVPAAGAGVSAGHTANVINSVIASNVANRTAELRAGTIAAAAPERAEDAANDLWFQIRHSDQETDSSGTGYASSTIKATTYQLGYDYQVSDTDYLGLYLSSTTGSADFNGAVSGSADIKSSLDVGLYGTHLLSEGQYLDYILHTGKFSLSHAGASADTKNFGILVGYGAKIRSNDDLTMNPYINFAYDTLKYDAFTYASGNVISADDQNNFSTKLGVNFDWASGLTTGLAYTRGLSGSYNPYINGIALPGVDNNYNILQLTLGYKNYINPTTYLNVSVDKTFVDYEGWMATGRINFFF